MGYKGSLLEGMEFPHSGEQDFEAITILDWR